MPIQKDYVSPLTGASASYHVVRTAALDYNTNRLVAQIASYVDKSTYTAQKQPVYIQSIEWPTLPVSGADVVGDIETRVIAPASDTSSPTVSRVSFAGGTIVDSVTAASTTDPATDTGSGVAETSTGSQSAATDSATENQAAA